MTSIRRRNFPTLAILAALCAPTSLGVCAQPDPLQPGAPRPLPPVAPFVESIPAPQQSISPPAQEGSATPFPNLPPDPSADRQDVLPPLEYELWQHGGSYLYAAEGDGFYEPHEGSHGHTKRLRLPEDWRAPQPFTLWDDFLGTGPIRENPRLSWPGATGYAWEPRLVLYGAYELLGIALEADDRRQDLIGHQMFVELDLRLTGTERAHAQWRPLGMGNTGGSYYQFSDPSGYVDNSTGIPERYWFEGELASILGGLLHDPFVPRDYHFVVGKFPFVLQNRLLMNDDVIGLVVNKNTIYAGNLSNLNVQGFLALDDVDAFTSGSANLYGVNATADYCRVLVESVYAYVQNTRQSSADEQYAAISATKLFGARTLTGRVMFKWGDQDGRGPGQLFVLEYNRIRDYDHGWFGIEKGVYYANAFRSTKGWNSISGGNFDRLRTAFAVDPLVIISAARAPDDNTGFACGVQYFRRHEDESLVPEFAWDAPGGASVWGIGLRYQRKTGPRSFFEIQGVENFSRDSRFRREGVFVTQTFVF